MAGQVQHEHVNAHIYLGVSELAVCLVIGLEVQGKEGSVPVIGDEDDIFAVRSGVELAVVQVEDARCFDGSL